MKKQHALLLAISLAAGLFTGSIALAADGHKHDHAAPPPASVGNLVVPTDKDAAWLEKARNAYPLKTCLVSDEEFGGDMGEPVERIYRVEGKPDRLIRFCCKGCIKDFVKDPGEFLAKLEKPSESNAGHSQHSH